MKPHLLKNPLLKEVVTREIIKYFESTGNENTTYQNLLAATEALLGRKFTVFYAYFENRCLKSITYVSTLKNHKG